MCDDSLGVNLPSLIPRDQLTATSVYDAQHEAYKGRLDGDSAWMPRWGSFLLLNFVFSASRPICFLFNETRRHLRHPEQSSDTHIFIYDTTRNRSTERRKKIVSEKKYCILLCPVCDINEDV